MSTTMPRWATAYRSAGSARRIWPTPAPFTIRPPVVVPPPADGRLFLDGEENNAQGRAMAHIVGGAQDGNSYELAWLGNMAYENQLANPFTGDKTVVALLNDTAAPANGPAFSTFANTAATRTSMPARSSRPGLRSTRPVSPAAACTAAT